MARTLGEGATVGDSAGATDSRKLGDGIAVGEALDAGLAGHPIDDDRPQLPTEPIDQGA